ncbi:hypothetical protein D3C75_978670 [compost metagenome]
MCASPVFSSQWIPRASSASSSSHPAWLSSCWSINHAPRCTSVTLSHCSCNAAAASTPNTPPPSTTAGPGVARMAFTSSSVRKVKTLGSWLPGIGGTNGWDPLANTSSSHASSRRSVRSVCAWAFTACTRSPLSTVTSRWRYHSSSCSRVAAALFSPPSTGES